MANFFILNKLKKLFGKTEKKAEADVIKIEKAVKKEAGEFIEEYKETKLAKYGYSFLKKIISPIIKFFWVAEIEGLHNIPKDGAVIIASNHESYFDFLCFASISPRKVHYLAAEKFFENKIWNVLMQLTGQIKVDRKNHNKSKVHQQVYSALYQGRVIGIFPEGTRSPDGKLLKAFTGVAKFALNSKTPVIPVGMTGTYEIMSRHDKFPKFKKAKIKIGEPMHFKEFYDMEHADDHFQAVTDKIMLKIAELTGEEYVHARFNKIKDKK